MKKLGIGKRLLSGLLALIMVLSLLPLSVFAAMGDLRDGETGLDANIDTKDTIYFSNANRETLWFKAVTCVCIHMKLRYFTAS